MHLLGAARSRGGGAGALQGGARQQSQTAGASHTAIHARGAAQLNEGAAVRRVRVLRILRFLYFKIRSVLYDWPAKIEHWPADSKF